MTATPIPDRVTYLGPSRLLFNREPGAWWKVDGVRTLGPLLPETEVSDR